MGGGVFGFSREEAGGADIHGKDGFSSSAGLGILMFSLSRAWKGDVSCIAATAPLP